MTRRTGAIAAAVIATALVVTCDVLVWLHHAHHWRHPFDSWLEGSISLPIWLAIGLLLIFRVPGNPLGVIAMVFAVLDGLHLFSGSMATYIASSGSISGTVDALTAVAIVVQILLVTGLIVFAQLATDGRLVSRRWWPVTAATVLGALVAAAGTLGSEPDVRQSVPAARAPIHGMSHELLHVLFSVAGVLTVFGIVGAVTGLVIRWRRGDEVERQQLKLVVFAAFVVAVLAILSQWSSYVVGNVLWAIIPSVLPASIAVAVLRYRLYDIDRIVSRTASYAVVTGFVVGAYVGLVALIESVLGFSSGVAVAASTLVVAGAFQPVRRRVQRTIDHRFDRAAYDARRTAEAFAQRLRDQVDVDQVRGDLLDTVTSVVAPREVSLWVAS